MVMLVPVSYLQNMEPERFDASVNLAHRCALDSGVDNKTRVNLTTVRGTDVIASLKHAIPTQV